MTRNKYIYITILLGLVLGSPLFNFRNSTTPNNQPGKTATNLVVEEASPDDNGYLPFTQASFDSQKNKRRVLFFYAAWCTTCRPVNAEFLQDGKKIPDDVVVFRVNFRDSDTDETENMLAKKYQITYQHTFIQVNKNGEVTKSGTEET